MTALLDTGFFYSLLNRAENSHPAVLAASAQLSGPVLLPTPVTTEVGYLILRDLGAEALADFVDSLAGSDLILIEPLAEDYQRAAGVIRQYRDSHIDFVDAIIVAIAERLDIRQILTLDQRHFRMFRPRHCSGFELIP